MNYLGPDQIETDTHVNRAGDAIMARVLSTPDKNGKQMLRSIERGTLNPESIAIAKVPYALFRSVDVSAARVNTSTGALIRERELVEIIISIIFAVAPRSGGTKSDPQAIGEGIRDAVLEWLAPNDLNNPNGWNRMNELPWFWNFSEDTNYKAKITKGVGDPIIVNKIADPLYSIPIQFKIWIQRTVKLT